MTTTTFAPTPENRAKAREILERKIESGRQSAGDLPQQLDSFALSRAALDLLAQITTIKILHRNMRMIIGNTQVVDLHDIRVIHLGDGLVFLKKAVKSTVTVPVLGCLAQDLQHHLYLRCFSLGKIDAGMLR